MVDDEYTGAVNHMEDRAQAVRRADQIKGYVIKDGKHFYSDLSSMTRPWEKLVYTSPNE